MHRPVETMNEDPKERLLFVTLEHLKNAAEMMMGREAADAMQENVDWRYVTVLMHPETGEVRTAEEWNEAPGGQSGLFEVRWNGSAWKAVEAQ